MAQCSREEPVEGLLTAWVTMPYGDAIMNFGSSTTQLCVNLLKNNVFTKLFMFVMMFVNYLIDLLAFNLLQIDWSLVIFEPF